jgi:hypothetical protein
MFHFGHRFAFREHSCRRSERLDETLLEGEQLLLAMIRGDHDLGDVLRKEQPRELDRLLHAPEQQPLEWESVYPLHDLHGEDKISDFLSAIPVARIAW